MRGYIRYILIGLWFLNPAGNFARDLDSLVRSADGLYNRNDYAAAQEKYLEILKAATADGNHPVMVRASLALARCHYFLYDRRAAQKWCYHALDITRDHRIDSLLSDVYYFLGALHIEAGRVDSAEKYSYGAIELARRKKDFSRVSQTYSTLAELHLNTTKDPVKIEAMITQAEKYADLAGNYAMMAFAKSKRYNYAFYLKKDYHEALNEINRAEELYHRSGNTESILNTYRGKAECLIMLRDTSARSYMLKWFAFKDSVLQAEKAVNVAMYETIFETERKEQENAILQQENERHRLLLLIVLVIFLLVVAVGFWWANRNGLRRKEHELELLRNLQVERERIARDLHDHVGGQLSYIIYSLDGINDESPERRTQLTASIGEAVRSVIGSLRETIWAISDSGIAVVDFSDKFKVMARALFKYSYTVVHFTENIREPGELNPLLGLNLYRICQEILNNAFKYANASLIEIEMYCEGHELVISISDNGIGFDPLLTNGDGYGLQNIRGRAEEFGISLTLQSEVGRGTKYCLQVSGIKEHNQES